MLWIRLLQVSPMLKPKSVIMLLLRMQAVTRAASLLEQFIQLYDLLETLFTTLETSRIRTHRRKRGLFNAVSYVEKFLFGTPDAEDADYYEKTLQRLSTDDASVRRFKLKFTL